MAQLLGHAKQRSNRLGCLRLLTGEAPQPNSTDLLERLVLLVGVQSGEGDRDQISGRGDRHGGTLGRGDGLHLSRPRRVMSHLQARLLTATAVASSSLADCQRESRRAPGQDAVVVA